MKLFNKELKTSDLLTKSKSLVISSSPALGRSSKAGEGDKVDKGYEGDKGDKVGVVIISLMLSLIGKGELLTKLTGESIKHGK